MDVSALNHLAQLKSKKDEENLENVVHCILYAPNAFKILEIAFDLVANPDSSEELVSKLLQIIHKVLMRFSFFAYRTTKYPADNLVSFCLELRNNIEKIIQRIGVNKHAKLRSYQMRFLTRACIYYGENFTTESFFIILNTSSRRLNAANYICPKFNELILKLIESLNHKMRVKIDDCIKKTLDVPSQKSSEFWANLMLLLEKQPIDLDVTKLAEFFTLTNINDIFRIHYLTKILIITFEKFDYNLKKFICGLITLTINNYFKILRYLKQPDQYRTILVDTLVHLQRLLEKMTSVYCNEKFFSHCLLKSVQENASIFADEIIENKPSDNCSLLEQLNNQAPRLVLVEKKINEHRYIFMFFITYLLQNCIRHKTLFATNCVHLFWDSIIPDSPFFDENPANRSVSFFFS